VEFLQHHMGPTLKHSPCRCERLTCTVNGDNIEISCNTCKKTMIIKTNGIKEAVESFFYKKEPIILNLKK